MRLPPSGAKVTLRQRRSFTLVELLTVIAIITLLVGLSIGAVMATIGFQHKKNTRFYMRELDGATKKRWDAVVQSAQKEDMTQTVGASAVSTIVSWAADNGGPRTRVMYVKFRLKQEFPTSFAEALNPYPLPPKPNYVAYLAKYGITAANAPATPAPYESAACLYMALTQSPTGQTFKADQFGNAVHDVNGPGGLIKAFTDDWNNPLVFCRWATGDPVLDSLAPAQRTNPTAQVRDLQDPDGQLVNNNWYTNAFTNNPNGVQQFETYGHSLTNTTSTNPNYNPSASPSYPQYAYYTIPVLVSAGPDGQLGLSNLQTLQRDGTNASADNIYSYNLN
jgi:hypothetical protein